MAFCKVSGFSQTKDDVMPETLNPKALKPYTKDSAASAGLPFLLGAGGDGIEFVIIAVVELRQRVLNDYQLFLLRAPN